jgi:glutamate-1-semialdehyde 2,1-aminomutase
MTDPQNHPVVKDIEARFESRTPRSKANDQEAQNRLPGGDTRTATYYLPYPAYMDHGQGCKLYDVDGNEYLDMLNNYTSLIHGHCHPGITKAAHAQLDKGTVFGSATEIQYKHAEHLCSRVPSLDMVRYGNSGTEGTLFAMRAARAFTGKELFIKMDGGYHGSHDYIEVNVFPGSVPAEGGTIPRHTEPGAPQSILNDMLVAPFNDLNAVEDLLKENQGQVAAVMTEPMLGALGMVAPQPGFLKGLRDLADKYGALLIFDEVITFRLSTGGLQKTENVTPDITALGKIIGGGMPVGGFGGRRDIMEPFSPRHPQTLFHSGTFNGADITMASGLAAMEAFDQAAVDHVNALGEKFRQGITAGFAKAGITGKATGLGSLAQVHWRLGDIVKAMDTVEGFFLAGELPRLLHLEMMNRGVYSAFRGMFVVSTPMTEADIDFALDAFAGALDVLMPYVKDIAPHLLAG